MPMLEVPGNLTDTGRDFLLRIRVTMKLGHVNVCKFLILAVHSFATAVLRVSVVESLLCFSEYHPTAGTIASQVLRNRPRLRVLQLPITGCLLDEGNGILSEVGGLVDVRLWEGRNERRRRDRVRLR